MNGLGPTPACCNLSWVVSDLARFVNSARIRGAREASNGQPDWLCMTSPQISFIVVTRARPECLLRALESIRRQTIDDREIVVVVNGADPETEEILHRFGSEVRAVVLPENRGVGAGRNTGIAYARGEVFFFLDDDAELCNRDTAKQVLTHFDNDVGLGVVSLLVIDGNTRQIELRCLPFRDKQLPERATPACYFAGGAAAIRRRVLDRVGLFDESLVLQL